MADALNAGDVVTRLRLDDSQFRSSIKNAHQQMQSFAQSLAKVGSYLTWRVTLPMTVFGKKAVKSFSEFNDAIIRAAAVTRGMTAEMRKEMEKTAIQLSKRSLFSATQLAEGYFALGQAGYTAAQEMKALPVVEEFATAAAIDLDTSIRYLARTAEGLGMAMDDPVSMMKSMEEVSNAFTFAAITTTAEIEDFAIAMTHAAAPALKLVNKDMKEGISVLMAFARAGIVSEEAGTLLWTTVRDLQRANIRFRHEWQKLNLAVYDSSGTMRNLADIFADLEAKFANMSDESKKASLQMLGFQDRSLRGIQALMGFSDEMKIFQKAMNNMGNLTKDVADTYKKSFNAQMKMAKHNIEAVAISVGWMLSPILIKINEQIKRFTTWWESLSSATKLLIVEIGILVTVLGPALLIFGKLVFLLSYATIGFKTLATAIIVGPIKAFLWLYAVMTGWLAIAIAVAAIAYTIRVAWLQGLDTVKKRFQEWYEAIRQSVEWLANEVFGEFFQWFQEAWQKILGITLDDVRNWLADIMVETNSVIAFWKQFPKAIKEAWTAADFSTALAKLREGLNEAKFAYIRSSEEFWKSTSKTRQAVDSFVTNTDALIRAMGEATKEHLSELGDALKKQFGEDVKAVTDLISEKVKMMNANLLDLLPAEDMQDIVVALDAAMKKLREIENIDVPIGRWEQFLNDVADLSERSTDIAINAFNGLGDTIATQLERGQADWKSFVASVLQEINRMIIKMILAEGIYEDFVRPAGAGLKAWLSSAGGLNRNPYNIGHPAQSPQINTNPYAIGQALGAVYNLGKLIPMQMGGIVNQPTFAPTGRNQTAYIGEAGPEAVMPLTRTRTGELGVKSQQPSVHVEPRIKIVNVSDRDEIIAAMRSEAGEKVIMNINRRNGIR